MSEPIGNQYIFYFKLPIFPTGNKGISPDFKIQCDIFGEDGSDEAVDDNGDYIYILWRPYTCCEVEAGFLIYIDFMKYPS